ncbi:MAG: RNA-binding protein [Polaromonas sp.]|uniref:RNA-binding protein n=1 Tax=Polaromonas sp. TaxID=1869339 RepID=UPI002732A1F0|nr:RNA-binding protein [Polaromonas sp.]MDP3797493.1 RNA-binding protein [Polaromonas sp.]
MKDFELTSKMLSMGGVFYPTGYAVIMFPDAADARKVASELEASNDGLMLLSPEIILEEISPADGHSDVHLPPVGTEGATVHKFGDLAREGHYGLMVPVHSGEDTERVMAVVRTVPFSYAQRYHSLAMEDLE